MTEQKNNYFFTELNKINKEKNSNRKEYNNKKKLNNNEFNIFKEYIEKELDSYNIEIYNDKIIEIINYFNKEIPKIKELKLLNSNFKDSYIKIIKFNQKVNNYNNNIDKYIEDLEEKNKNLNKIIIKIEDINIKKIKIEKKEFTDKDKKYKSYVDKLISKYFNFIDIINDKINNYELKIKKLNKIKEIINEILNNQSQRFSKDYIINIIDNYIKKLEEIERNTNIKYKTINLKELENEINKLKIEIGDILSINTNNFFSIQNKENINVKLTELLSLFEKINQNISKIIESYKNKLKGDIVLKKQEINNKKNELLDSIKNCIEKILEKINNSNLHQDIRNRIQNVLNEINKIPKNSNLTEKLKLLIQEISKVKFQPIV
jgi:hypothetical protein